MKSALRHHGRRGGLTLIELLVTVFILLLITAIAIPVVAPSGDERRTRETSRLVTSFIQGARTRAIQTGRPFGVMIEPLDGIPEAAVQLSYAEVQQPYTGESVDSRVHVVATFLSGESFMRGGIGLFVNSFGVALPESAWVGLIRPGDIIKLGYQGHYFVVQPGEPYRDDNNNGAWNSGEPFVDVDRDGNYDTAASCTDAATGYISSLPWTLSPLTSPVTFASQFNDLDSDGRYDTGTPGEGDGVPFQILRQPVKTAAPPLTLPEGMVIDLAGSGFSGNFLGPEPLNDANNSRKWESGENFTDLDGDGVWDVGVRGPYIILFSPGGSLSALTYFNAPPNGLVNGPKGAPASLVPTAPLHLLVGNNENAPATPGQENWRDLRSLWISIHPHTGLVTGTEVSEFPSDTDNTATAGIDESVEITSVTESRELAERGQGLNGR